MLHLKLFENYFMDKKEEIHDEYLQKISDLRKEFDDQIETYVEMFSDEFNNFTINKVNRNPDDPFETILNFEVESEKIETLFSIFKQAYECSIKDQDFFIQMELSDDIYTMPIKTYNSYHGIDIELSIKELKSRKKKKITVEITFKDDIEME